MSLLDSASLICTPNGYKEGKLYSVIPSDGSGDMSVVRATTATRVNSAGLVELVPYNLLTYSEQFDNVAWTKFNATVTANTAVAPDGNTTADTITSNASSGGDVYLSINISGVHTLSAYFKEGTTNICRLGSTVGGFADFNLTNQTYTLYSGISASITSVGNGWNRCTLTVDITSTTLIYLSSKDISTKTVYAWGAQLVEGSTALPYQKTETRLNIPRLDYSNGTCPSLLVEPQRTNLALYSEQLNNAEYTVEGGAFSANAAVSPSGFINAELFTENSSNSAHGFYAPVVARGTTGQPLTTSIFAKSNGRRYISLIGGFDSGNAYYALYDLQDGVVTSFSNIGSTTYIDSTITNYGNGWYRCTLTGSSTFINRILFSYLADSPTGISAIGIKTYTGNGTAGVFLYGFQVEVGSYPTSYIPTTSASVTRNADAIFKTGISSLIGSSEGSAFFEGVINDTGSLSAVFFEIVNGTSTTNTIVLYIDTTTGQIGLYLGITGSTYNLTLVSFKGQNAKIAFRWKANDYAFYLNGAQVYTNTSAAAPSGMNTLRIGNNRDGQDIGKNEVKASALWTTALTNDELAQLTTI